MIYDAPNLLPACPVYQETFRRAENLKRHILTREDLTSSAGRTCPLTRDVDDDAKPHTCHFCRAQYRRRDFNDALRRHWKTCTARIAAGTEITKRSLSGKRNQANDLCTARKRACSTAECTSHCVQSSTHLHESLDSTGRTPSKTTHPGSAVQGVMEQIQAQAQGIVSHPHDRSTSIQGPRLGFLANFTRANGFNEAYSYGSQSATIDLSPSLLKEQGGADGDGLQGATASNPFDCYLNEFESCLLSNTDTGRDPDPIEEILQRIPDSPTAQYSRVTASEWFEFCLPANSTQYLRLFWTRWYHYCPIIQKATFDLNTCSHILLATRALLSNALFLESPRLGSRNENLLQIRENIQILGATCFMCLLQKSIRLPHARHPRIDLNSSETVEAWNEYIFKAETIRTFNHFFLLDSAFVIFHNSVPRMVLQEMTIDLTRPEDVFQAMSPAEFTRAPKLHPACTVPLLTDCVRNLCAETPGPEVTAHLGHAGALNLFTIATGEESPK
ncbi:hypothetical protein BDW67DRAFT_175292 [Aspergillus spinulosporus]